MKKENLVPKIKGIVNAYNHTKANVNNLSYWFPKIKDHKCKELKVPYTFVKDVPVQVFKSFYMDRYEEDTEVVYEWVKNDLIPSLPERLRGLVFVRNGCYADKFRFGNCGTRCNAIDLAKSIREINHNSHLVGAGGSTEIVVRERILANERFVPTIYGGLPLRPEFRVFYDFDKKKVLYVVNYWDWDRCLRFMRRNMTDQIVYTHEYNSILKVYKKHKDKVAELVKNAMKDVELTGAWSIDVLLNQTDLLNPTGETNEFWLIDMAVAEQSAYWDKEKAEGK